MLLRFALVVTFLAQFVFGLTPAKRSYDTHNYYVVEHQSDAGASLADVACALDVEVVERAGELEKFWVVRSEKPQEQLITRGEITDPVLDKWEQLRRRAASELDTRSEDVIHVRSIVSSVRYFSRQVLRQREKRAPPPIRPPTPGPLVQDVVQKFGINDPLFPQQWHLVNEDYPQHMMNVTSLWEMGLTGKGVITSLVDDGVDFKSEDLAANFVCPINCSSLENL